MTKTLKDKMAELPAARRAAIEDRAAQLHAEYLTLQELRKAKDLTQVQLAKTLNIKQATIAKMEKRSDLLISTLRGYVEAMGGRLNLLVEFPGQKPVSLDGLGDTENLRAPATGKSAKSQAGAHVEQG